MLGNACAYMCTISILSAQTLYACTCISEQHNKPDEVFYRINLWDCIYMYAHVQVINAGSYQATIIIFGGKRVTKRVGKVKD